MSESNLELCYMPATEAIKKFKEKTLSPVELVSEIIKRSEEINEKLNVFNFTCFSMYIDLAFFCFLSTENKIGAVIPSV